MQRAIVLRGQEICYELERKKVKHVNLRVRADGTIYVSANKSVSQARINAILQAKADFILHALEHYRCMAEKEKIAYYSEEEICEEIARMCQKVYPYFAARGVAYPQIKFRKMKSRWGSCRPAEGILTFNVRLRFAPPTCVLYVVLHEFTHFLQANHSSAFYAELEKTCPDWKRCRQELKEIPCETD